MREGLERTGERSDLLVNMNNNGNCLFCSLKACSNSLNLKKSLKKANLKHTGNFL